MKKENNRTHRVYGFRRTISLLLVLLTVMTGVIPTISASAYAKAKALPALTGDQQKDIVNIALSQVGYKADSNLYNIYNYDFYGENDGGRWCAVFVWWCAKQAGVPESVINKTAAVRDMKAQQTIPASGAPQPGDIVRFGPNKNSLGHAGIVVSYNASNRSMLIVDGNNVGNGKELTSVVRRTVYIDSATGADRVDHFLRPNYNSKSEPVKLETIAVGKYSLRNAGGKYINASTDKNGADVTTSDKTKSTKLEFNITKTGSAYHIASVASPTKRRVNINSDGASNAGMKVTMWEPTTHSTQQWVFEAFNGGYILHPVSNTSVALTLQSNGTLQLANNAKSANQTWYLDAPVTDPEPVPVDPTPDPEPIPVDPTPEPVDPIPDPKPVDPYSVVLTTTVTEVGVKLDWTPSNNALGYRIYRATSANGEGISITDFPIIDKEYVDVNVNEFTTYYYSIRPVNSEASFNTSTMELTSENLGAESTKVRADVGALTPDKVKEKGFILMQLGKDTMRVDETIMEIDPGRGTAPTLLNGRTVVPIRAIVEVMDGTVGWEAEAQKISLVAYGHDVDMWVDQKNIVRDGESLEIDVAPTIINSRTMVPVRFVAENIGCEIEWIGSTQQIIIVYYK